MDTGLHSDSDTSNSTAGVMDANWLNDFGAGDFARFDPSDFPNLQYGMSAVNIILRSVISIKI